MPWIRVVLASLTDIFCIVFAFLLMWCDRLQYSRGLHIWIYRVRDNALGRCKEDWWQNSFALDRAAFRIGIGLHLLLQKESHFITALESSWRPLLKDSNPQSKVWAATKISWLSMHGTFAVFCIPNKDELISGCTSYWNWGLKWLAKSAKDHTEGSNIFFWLFTQVRNFRDAEADTVFVCLHKYASMGTKLVN